MGNRAKGLLDQGNTVLFAFEEAIGRTARLPAWLGCCITWDLSAGKNGKTYTHTHTRKIKQNFDTVIIGDIKIVQFNLTDYKFVNINTSYS